MPFERLPQPADRHHDLTRARNVLNYAKSGDASYSARKYPAGYHTLQMGGETILGQRNPSQRLALAPINFSGKSILDLGSNQGGMLHALGGEIKWGVGLDYDARLVNAANLISGIKKHEHLRFYAFNLETDPLRLIGHFLPESKVDIVFLLSVCMWIENWRQVIDFSSDISKSMLFETNGSKKQKDEQENYLRKLYGGICAESSEDDPGKKERRLLFCQT